MIPDRFIQVGRVLQQLTETGNETHANPNAPSTFFHSSMVPDLSIQCYFIYVAMNSGMQAEQALCVLILVERVCKRSYAAGKPLVINSMTAHRLVLGTVLVLTKMYNDIYFSNADIANMAGIPLADLNRIELYLL